jgi:hypothetical protein
MIHAARCRVGPSFPPLEETPLTAAQERVRERKKEGQMKSEMQRISIGAVFLGICLTVMAGTANAQTITQVMSGLDAPRGLAIGPEGGLYVTEAGNGTNTGPCTAVAAGMNCYSETGKITRLYRGQQERVVTGLPSIFNTARGDIVGPNDISFQGRGTAAVTIGWGGNPALRANLGSVGSQVGVLLQVEPSGRWRVDADISDFEDQHNPAGGPKDSNPYGVLILAGDRYVTDAGGNDLLHVAANGDVSLVAVLPSVPAPAAEAVPTEVEMGPDGSLYVSLLTGAPFTAGVAGVYKIVSGQAPQLFQGGFKTIIDFTFGPDGSMYVLEHATSQTFFGGPGRLTKVAPNGTRTVITTALSRPTSVLVDTDGVIYVSNKGTSVGTGEVLRIQP